MHGRWMRRGMALGLAAMGFLCGCDGRMQTSTPMVWETATEATQAPLTPLSFPITLPSSTLVVEELVSYQGQYWEDGSGDPVEGVAGIMLCNPTNRMIEFASFALEHAGEQLYFFAYRLPPMSRCLVLEYNRKNCTTQEVTACRELCIRWDQQEFSREQIDYVGLGPLMTIINRDARQLHHVTVWYKHYVQEEDYYLGGAAYSAHLFFLEPEERRTIQPEHYDAGHARIVGIQLET